MHPSEPCTVAARLENFEAGMPKGKVLETTPGNIDCADRGTMCGWEPGFYGGTHLNRKYYIGYMGKDA